MHRKLLILAIGMALLPAVAAVFVALVLAAPMFSDLRRAFVGDFLSGQIGQALIITDDVRAKLGVSRVRLVVSGVEIPSEAVSGTNLAEMERLEADVRLRALWSGGKLLDNIELDGLRVDLETRADGTTTWTPAPRSPVEAAGPTHGGLRGVNGIVFFLSDKTVEVNAVRLLLRNEITGFDFDYELSVLELAQLESGQRVLLDGRGVVNGLPFSIDGTYTPGGSSLTRLAFDELELSFEGRAVSSGEGYGIAGILDVTTNDIGDLFEVLKLNRPAEGSGRVTVDLASLDDRFEVKAFDARLEARSGKVFTLTGNAADLLSLDGVDLEFAGDFFPQGRIPRPAETIRDLRLVNVRTRVVAKEGRIAVADMVVETNMFETELENIGPFLIGQIKRLDSGELSLSDVRAQIGPADTPYLTAQGNVTDLLNAKGIGFSGDLQIPARLVFPNLHADQVAAFGALDGTFELSDARGKLALSRFDLATRDTDLWTLRITASARDVGSFDGSDFDLEARVPDSGQFLEAMQATPVDAGPVMLTASVSGVEQGVRTTFAAGVNASVVHADITTTVDARLRPFVRGKIASAELAMRDLDQATEIALSVRRMKDREKQDDKREVQPLVIAMQAQDEAIDARQLAPDGREIQPLILLDTRVTERAEDERTVQPLVLEPVPLRDLDASALLDPEKLGRELDLEIDLDIAKIEGASGVSNLSARLVSKDGKARFWPLDFKYGGGYFNVGAAIDFIDAPDYAWVHGATDGWDFGRILNEVGIGIPASGKIGARFDVRGRYASATQFMKSVTGTVNLYMNNARIGSSLLELAGLGLFPWLFSQELQKGYTDIVCFEAPLQLRGGKASSNALVLETRRVQLVAAGTIDWARDRIALRGEPRPLGRGLNRSPWPFEVSGKLSNPDFRIVRKRKDNPIDRTARASGTEVARKPCVPDISQVR